MSARDALVGTIYTFIHPIYGNQNHTAQAVVAYLHKAQCRYIPLLWRGGRRSLTGWLCRICMIYTFIHPIYGNHYLLAQGGWICTMSALFQQSQRICTRAVVVIPNGTLSYV